MKNQILGPDYFWLLFILCSICGFIGCEAQNPVDNYNFDRFVPDNTPFIVGLLEASKDTVHHYPEVFVGTVTSLEGQNLRDLKTASGVWWPIQNGQIAFPTGRFNLDRLPDENASVSIIGPLNSNEKKMVQFLHQGNGVYADKNFELRLNEGEEYELFVVMSDGRRYKAKTRIPKSFEFNVPDSLEVELELKQFHTGVQYEQEKEKVKLPFKPDPETGYVTYQVNSEYDHFNMGVPKGGFLFEDRGNFLREGSAYGLWDLDSFPDKLELRTGWFYPSNQPLRNSVHLWISLSQLSEELSRFYFAPFMYVGIEVGGRWDKRDFEQNQAVVERDSTYLYKISNITKLNEAGEVLPKDRTDAIGVFGGYNAAYKTMVLLPTRSWDPDTLNWGYQ